MRVRIEAPSSPFMPEKLSAGLARLKGAGWSIDGASADLPGVTRGGTGPDGHELSGSAVLPRLLRGTHAYLNGSDDERLVALEAALDADVDVVWLARGGYGLTRIVRRVRRARPPRGSPIVVGFSDATALFAHLVGSGVRCVHGPLATTIAAEPEASFAHAVAVIERRARGTALPVATDAAHAGLDVEGWLFAGNLCVLAHLAGTPSAPHLGGAVLVLEEVGERPYRIDRALTQLCESGMLEGVRAVVVGHLTGCDEPRPAEVAAAPVRTSPLRDPPPRPLDVIRERLGAMGIPMAHGLAAGHEPPNFALPLGTRVRLTGDRLTLLEDLP